METSCTSPAKISSSFSSPAIKQEEIKPSSLQTKSGYIEQVSIEEFAGSNIKTENLLEPTLDTVVENIIKERVASNNVAVEEGEKYDLSLKNLPDNYKETYNTFIGEVEAAISVPILKSVSEDYIKNFKHFNERYYEDRYCIDFGVKDPGYSDTSIRIHTNKLILVALASGNDIIRNGKPITYINFVINNVDRSQVNVRGKRKMGSKKLGPGTILCQVQCEGDEKLYNIRAGINGNLIEVNDHIKTCPDLIRSDPKGLGFIAVISPQGRPDHYEENINRHNLLSEAEYVTHITNRPSKSL